jgi:integrase
LHVFESQAFFNSSQTPTSFPDSSFPFVQISDLRDHLSSCTRSEKEGDNGASSARKSYRNFFRRAAGKKTAKIDPKTDSTARNGEVVQRRRFQRGSVFLSKSKTQWLGMYSEYVRDTHGVEKRIRHQIVLCPAKKEGRSIGKKEAQKLLQPHVDKVNFSLSASDRERKTATFEAFAEIWERDYLSLSKASTQSGAKSNLKRLKAAFGKRDIRQIDAGDLQRFVAASLAQGLSPKTVRNLWGTANLIWQAALAQKYVDVVLPKPKLPRKPRTKARFFTLPDVAMMIAASEGEHRVFYWLAAETGLRSGELAGLKLTDIEGECLSVNRSVWSGKEQAPKTNNAFRKLALSPQLISLLWEQIARQKKKGHEYLFSLSTGNPWDMNVYRQRKLAVLLKSLGIPKAGFHAFRHFNVSLLDALRVPLKTIQERLGHALTGSFTLDVYGGQPEWERNLEAARLAGAEIEKAVQKVEKEERKLLIVSLTAAKTKMASDRESETIDIA